MGTRRKAILVALVVVGALTLFVCAGAFAADPAVDVTVSATIASTIQLTMPTTTVTWGAAVPGTVMTADITASINSNKDYALKVTKNRDLTGTGATPPVIPTGT